MTVSLKTCRVEQQRLINLVLLGIVFYTMTVTCKLKYPGYYAKVQQT